MLRRRIGQTCWRPLDAEPLREQERLQPPHSPGRRRPRPHRLGATNATTACLFVAHVNWSLNAQVAFPHTSTWHLVLANPYAISLLHSLTVTLYQWTPTATDLIGTLLDGFSEGLGWLVTVAVLALVVIPGVCSRLRRHGSHATHSDETIYDEGIA